MSENWKVIDQSIDLAKRIFEKRGDKSEVHLDSNTLAAYLALAIEKGIDASRQELKDAASSLEAAAKEMEIMAGVNGINMHKAIIAARTRADHIYRFLGGKP